MRRILSMALAGTLAFFLVVAMPAPALAVINFGTVSVSLPGSVSLTTGSTTTVSCTVSPASHSQAPNCFTSYCPSGCGVGASADCTDANGQCTCYGSAYSMYYTSVNVSSSNPAVARASYSGGALSITGYSAGTSTITVSGDLRLWSSGYGSITVTVSDPAPVVQEQPSPTPSTNTSTSTNTGNTNSSSGSASTGASSSGAVAGAVSVTSSGVSSSSALASVLSATVSGDKTEVSEGAATEDVSVELAKIGEAKVSEVLGAVAGTQNQACFWTGESAEEADYLWSFSGASLSAEAAAAADDLDLTVSDVSDDAMWEPLGDMSFIALDFACREAFPVAATFGYKVSDVFENGARVALYNYDERSGELVLVEKGIEVKNGYATFTVDHGALYVLAESDDLEGPLASEDSKADDTSEKAADAPSADETDATLPVGVIAAVAAAVVAVGGACAALAVRARRKKAAVASGDAPSAPDGDAPSAPDALDAGTSDAGLDDAQEKKDDAPDADADDSDTDSKNTQSETESEDAR